MATYRIVDARGTREPTFQVVIVTPDGGEELISTRYPTREAALRRIQSLRHDDIET